MALSYTSVDKMLDILPIVGSVSALSSAQLFLFAEHAEARVNAKLARHYEIPVSGNPPVLEAIATDLALYRTLSLNIFTQERMNDSDWPDRFKEAQELLDEIASNEIILVNSAGTVIAQRTDEAEIKTTTEGYHSTFWEGPETEQIQDVDKINDLADDRDITADSIVR